MTRLCNLVGMEKNDRIMLVDVVTDGTIRRAFC